MREISNYTRSFSALIGMLLVVGTCGFVILEGWPVLDALYMTVITLSTVGYGETSELSDPGRVFAAILIGVSVVSMACWTASITSAVVNDELTGRFKQRQEKKMIRKLSGHAVVCGSGILARTVVKELIKCDKPLVVVTDDKKGIEYFKLTSPGILIVNGDPKSELAMADANCFAAASIIAATDNDFDNLLITITARGLGEHVKVISCAKTTELTSRMMKTGADEVICPFVLGGEKAARLVA